MTAGNGARQAGNRDSRLGTWADIGCAQRRGWDSRLVHSRGIDSLPTLLDETRARRCSLDVEKFRESLLDLRREF
jgi:hypothetical protein